MDTLLKAQELRESEGVSWRNIAISLVTEWLQVKSPVNNTRDVSQTTAGPLTCL